MKFDLKFLALPLVAAVSLYAIQAYAQVPDAATRAADPARAADRIERGEQAFEEVSPIEIDEGALLEAPPNADEIFLTLNSLSIEGATAFPESRLAVFYEDLIGTEITLTEIYRVANDMTRFYRNEGYVLTQVIVPPQTIDSGNVRLQVVEGFINRIDVDGADRESEQALQLIRLYTKGMQTGEEALNIAALERALLMINELAGIEARAILDESPDTPGGADVLIVIERTLADGFLGVDNHGTRYLGPLQVIGSAGVNSVMGMNERLSVTGVVAPDDGPSSELGYIGAQYEQPFGPLGSKLTLFGSYTETDPGHDLADLDVEGTSKTIGARYEVPIYWTRRTSVFMNAQFDWRDVDSRNNVEVFDREDRLRVARLGVRGEFLENWVLGNALNTMEFTVSKGLNVFDATDEDSVNTSRAGAGWDFTKIEGEVTRLQRLGSGWNMLFGVSGQWASDGLLSSEEYGLGGLSYARGYDSSEVTGDDGLAGKIELQWNDPFSVSWLDSWQMFGFYDAGRVWNHDAASSNLKRDTLTSTGGGLRVGITEDTSFGAMVAFPLNRDIASYGDDDPRGYLSLYHRF